MPVDAAADEQFGPYLVYERLGVGGMATVHRALEQGTEGFERMVALKRLLPHLAEDASFIKSFVREAKLASILNHVNIVQIYELGRVGTEYFISMEYIDGRDLRRILRHARKVTGPPPINITVGLMIQLCDALDYAHNKVDEDGHPLGLVHRDISPSNLIVTSGGHLKIIDFGIAKAQSSQLRTHTGRVKGKLAYMAPEAVSGSRDLDARSDIWAAGVILHELLTARPLFASKNEYQTLLKVQRGDIMPPSTFNHACPSDLDAIVFRALARDADQRYASAAELRDALIKLKQQHAMQTGYRDIATWLDWAFGLEPPASFSTSPDSSGVSSPETPKNIRHKTPRPARNTEEDEAVEVVWGGGNVESEDGPVVLDEVPDVSEKHQRPKQDSGKFDDIPTPLPSHGTMPSIYHSEQIIAAQPEPTARGSERMRAQRQTTQHTIPRKPTGVHAVVRGNETPVPSRPARSTSQGVPVQAIDSPQLSERMAAQRARTESGVHDKPPVQRPSSQPDAHRLPTNPGQPDPAKLFAAGAGEPRARPSTNMDERPTLEALPLQRPQPPSQPQPLPLQPPVDDDAPTLSQSSSGPLPVVRFARSTAAPPPSQPAITRAQSPSRSPSPVRIGESIAARGSSRPTWLLVLGGLVLAGGAAAAVVTAVAKGKDKTAQQEPAPPPVRDTGTVRFVLEPPDAEIKIAGAPAHAGSPWSTELAAGAHQIEIHRQGHKSWLTSIELSPNETQTLRVVLEPLTSVVAEASLTVATTPANLEVLIDGQLQAQRTPLKTTLKPGAHKIVLRQDGVEVWHQTLNAEPSSDYEFNPSFTADKQRERAQRTTTRTAPAPARDSSEIAAEKLGTTPAPAPSPTAPAAPSPTAPTPPPPTPTPSITQPAPPPAPTGAPPTTASATAPAPKQTPPPPAPKQAPPTSPQKQITTAVPPTTIAPAPGKVPSAPPIVPPVAVKKLSGDPPSIARHRNLELPASLAAKLCIDASGKVTSADMMTKVDRRVANDITAELREWRYAPYKLNGTPSPACFVVTLRTK